METSSEVVSKRSFNTPAILLLILLIVSIGGNMWLLYNQRTLYDMTSHIETTINEIKVRFGWGGDCQKYITPDDPLVTELVFNITGRWGSEVDTNERWEDYGKLFNWVRTNVAQNYDNSVPIIDSYGSIKDWFGEFWRFPNETIVDQCGDCEDRAVLLTSMILCYTNQSYYCWAIEWENSITKHSATAIPVQDGQLTILDPAGNYYTSTTSGYLTSKNVTTAINEWFQHWQIDYSDLYVNRVFSDEIHETFISNQDFFDWFNRI